jgi:hypothetical protein
VKDPMLDLWEALGNIHRKYTFPDERLKDSFTSREYCKQFHVTRSEFRHLIGKMIRDGIVERIGNFKGRSYYRLTKQS